MWCLKCLLWCLLTYWICFVVFLVGNKYVGHMWTQRWREVAAAAMFLLSCSSSSLYWAAEFPPSAVCVPPGGQHLQSASCSLRLDRKPDLSVFLMWTFISPLTSFCFFFFFLNLIACCHKFHSNISFLEKCTLSDYSSHLAFWFRFLGWALSSMRKVSPE